MTQSTLPSLRYLQAALLRLSAGQAGELDTAALQTLLSEELSSATWSVLNDPAVWAKPGPLLALQCSLYLAVAAGVNQSRTPLRAAELSAGLASLADRALEAGLPVAADLLVALGRGYLNRCDFAAAQASLERALAADETRAEEAPRAVARDLHSIGEIQQILGEFDAAAYSFERALAITKANPSSPDHARDLFALALLNKERGAAQDALAILEQVLQIDQSQPQPDAAALARDHYGLGLVWQDLGDLEEARGHLDQAVTLAEQTLGIYHPN